MADTRIALGHLFKGLGGAAKDIDRNLREESRRNRSFARDMQRLQDIENRFQKTQAATQKRFDITQKAKTEKERKTTELKTRERTLKSDVTGFQRRIGIEKEKRSDRQKEEAKFDNPNFRYDQFIQGKYTPVPGSKEEIIFNTKFEKASGDDKDIFSEKELAKQFIKLPRTADEADGGLSQEEFGYSLQNYIKLIDLQLSPELAGPELPNEADLLPPPQQEGPLGYYNYLNNPPQQQQVPQQQQFPQDITDPTDTLPALDQIAPGDPISQPAEEIDEKILDTHGSKKYTGWKELTYEQKLLIFLADKQEEGSLN